MFWNHISTLLQNKYRGKTDKFRFAVHVWVWVAQMECRFFSYWPIDWLKSSENFSRPRFSSVNKSPTQVGCVQYSVIWNILAAVNTESCDPRSDCDEDFTALHNKLQDNQFCHNTFFLPFRINLIDFCFLSVPLSDIQNACLLVPHSLPCVAPRDLTINCTLYIYQFAFAIISQKYSLSKMHSLPLSFQLGCIARHWMKKYKTDVQCPMLSACLLVKVTESLQRGYFDPTVLQQE